jgi:D-alanyl-D-alanine carboxypeptidase/D-alanyl-D-alanine-endopeptidase (penicillin-binding protein 4)
VHPVLIPSRSLVALAGLALAASALAPVPAGAATPAPTSTAGLSPASVAAQARMARLLPLRVRAAAALGGLRTGLVEDLEADRPIWATGSSTPMRGASTTKLATAVTALSLLGTTTRFPTRVVTGRTPQEIVLVAGGDPMLTSGQLGRLARATALALLPTLAPAPAPRATVTTTVATTVSPPDGTPPATPGRRVPPHAVRVTVRLDDTLFPVPTLAVGWPAGYVPSVVRPVRPLVRDFRGGWDTAKDAATWFSARVDAELRALTAGRVDIRLSADYGGRLARPAASTEIARFAGNTSGAALTRMLLISDNDIAEMLFRDDAVAAGRSGSWSDASRAETDRLAALSIPTAGWRLYDGSGVSRSDRVSAVGLVGLLRAAQSPSHPELRALKGLLPVAGTSGTLQHRFLGAPTRCARGKVFAKTGTLHDTIALAGYALGTDKRLRAFAVLVDVVSTRYSQAAVRAAVEVVPATATGCY